MLVKKRKRSTIGVEFVKLEINSSKACYSKIELLIKTMRTSKLINLLFCKSPVLSFKFYVKFYSFIIWDEFKVG